MRLRSMLVLILIFGLFVSACSGSSGSGKQDVVVVAMEAEPPNMDPAQYSGSHNARVLFRMFEGLTRYKAGSTDVEPALAESWQVTPDGLVYTFKLRQNVKFHDGTPFDAEAVKLSFERPMIKEHPNYKDGKWTFVTTSLGMVKTVEAVDKSTVKITLNQPHAAFLTRLADISTAILSPKAIKEFGADTATKPVGTGPYKFNKWERGNNITLDKNPDYWGTKAKNDQLVYRFIIEAQARMNELLTGSVDVAIALPPDFVEKLKTNKDITVLQDKGIHFWYVGMNHDVKPLDNVLVRQAIAHAINKQALVKDILRGTAVEGFSPIQPGTWGHNAKVTKYDYNPEKAKQLLAQAGFPNGFEIKLWVPESGSGMQSPKEMATVIQSDLAKVGIKTQMTTFEWTTYLANLNKGTDHAIFVNSWMAGAEDPDMLLSFLYHSRKIPFPNRAHYRNTEVDGLIDKAGTLTDRNERVKLYGQVQEIIAKEVPYVVIDHDVQTLATRASLKGLQLHPSYDVKLETVSHQ